MISEGQNKIALITGANKGIGFETARQLGAQGFTILVGARNTERGTEAAAKLQAAGSDAHFIRIEVTNQASIDSAAKKIEERYGKLDVLINNVGVALDRTSTLGLDISLLKETFETNFFSMFAVSKAMIPLIHKSHAGRIVNMSSALGSLTKHSDPSFEFYNAKALAYNSSKTAVNQLTVHLAHELKDTPIKVNSACPGFTATDLNHFQGTRTVEEAATVVVRLATLPDNGPTGQFFDDTGALPW
ncbi:SDR family oxidoreductase [Bacillus mycoides]|uniref:SDR family oxidoreductase n=1 Tax=Bacillus mycoides TaxID=1405 RepID=UPI0035CAD1C7